MRTSPETVAVTVLPVVRFLIVATPLFLEVAWMIIWAVSPGENDVPDHSLILPSDRYTHHAGQDL
jgi:hypothetical protein